jgi:hypothetical protein
MNIREKVVVCESPQPGTAVTTSTLAGMTGIFEIDTQILVWSRDIPDALSDYMARAATRMGSSLRVLMAPGEPLPDSLLPVLPEAPQHEGRTVMQSDIEMLVEVFADLMDCPQVALRLEVLHRAMCPRFHTDHVGIRLVCAYRGDGTQWIDDVGADRRKLGRGSEGLPDEASGLMTIGTPVHTIPPFHVALLKGSLWQGNGARGVIHRSPAIAPEQAPRVLLALDALWPD